MRGDFEVALSQYLAMLSDPDLAAILVPETFAAWLSALCTAAMTADLKPLATRLLKFVLEKHPSFFYHPVLAAIKAATSATVRHGMLRLALMLALLPPADVLPRDLIGAALNQTCTLGLLSFLYECKAVVDACRLGKVVPFAVLGVVSLICLSFGFSGSGTK